MDIMWGSETTIGGWGITQTERDGWGHGSLSVVKVKCHWLLENHANEMQIRGTVCKGEWVSH